MGHTWVTEDGMYVSKVLLYKIQVTRGMVCEYVGAYVGRRACLSLSLSLSLSLCVCVCVSRRSFRNAFLDARLCAKQT